MLKIGTYENKLEFRPGEEIAGKVLSIQDKPPRSIEIEIIWLVRVGTSARVTQVEKNVVKPTGKSGEYDFKFRLPDSPYSYVGTMSSLEWAIQAKAGREKDKLRFSCSPVGSAIRIVSSNHLFLIK